MSTAAATAKPPQWAVLQQALREKRPVRARYHGTERLLCPHILGWKNGRPKVLCYQASSTDRPHPADHPEQQWRSMFVDEIDQPAITDEPWQSAHNYSHATNAVDQLEIAVETPTLPS